MVVVAGLVPSADWFFTLRRKSLGRRDRPGGETAGDSISLKICHRDH
jgi:hypothetical protein